MTDVLKSQGFHFPAHSEIISPGSGKNILQVHFCPKKGTQGKNAKSANWLSFTDLLNHHPDPIQVLNVGEGRFCISGSLGGHPQRWKIGSRL